MENILYFKNKKINSAFAISVFTHLLFFAWIFWMTSSSLNVPFGVSRKGMPTVIEMGFSDQTQKLKKIKTEKIVEKISMNGTLPVKALEPTKKVEVQDSGRSNIQELARFGLKEGTVENGELGHSKGYEATEQQRYIYELRVIIENRKTYPQIAKQLGEMGRVIVKFNIMKDGTIENVELKSSTRFERLNQAAFKLIEGLERYKPIPLTSRLEKMTLELPIEYVLN